MSPYIFALPHVSSTFTYILAGIHLLLTIFTNFEFGIFKIIPLKAHGWTELVVSIALLGLAFYLQAIGDDLGYNYYIGFAAAVFLTWMLTDYHSFNIGKRMN